MTQNLPQWDVFLPTDDTVEFAKYGSLIEIARYTIDHHLPQGGYKLHHVIVHYADSKKGQKFRMNLCLADLHRGWVRITTFGSVEYAHLRVKDLHEAGTPNGKSIDEVFKYDQVDRGEGFTPETPGHGALKSMRGPTLRAAEYNDNLRFMRELSNQLFEELQHEITGETKTPNEKPKDRLDPSFFKAMQNAASQSAQQAAEQVVKRTREETYGDW